jgi:hypothetical protein
VGFWRYQSFVNYKTAAAAAALQYPGAQQIVFVWAAIRAEPFQRDPRLASDAACTSVVRPLYVQVDCSEPTGTDRTLLTLISRESKTCPPRLPLTGSWQTLKGDGLRQSVLCIFRVRSFQMIE